MKTEQIIDQFRRDPFNTKEQTTLVRAQGGVLMTRQRECGGALIADPRHDKNSPTTGREAWVSTLSKYKQDLANGEEPHLRDPHSFFCDPDLTTSDWVPLVIALDDPIVGDHTDDFNNPIKHTFIGCRQPGYRGGLFDSSRLFGRRAASWAYDQLQRQCSLVLPDVVMHGIRIPSRSRKLCNNTIATRAVQKAFAHPHGGMGEKSDFYWQLAWSVYLSSNLEYEHKLNSTFGVGATKYLGNQFVTRLVEHIKELREDIVSKQPIQYLDKYRSFQELVSQAYHDENVITRFSGHQMKFVMGHLSDSEIPFRSPQQYRHMHGSLVRVVDSYGKSVCPFTHDAKAPEQWDKKWEERRKKFDSAPSHDSTDYVGFAVPNFSLLRENWQSMVGFFNGCGFPEPKPFGFAFNKENESSLAVLADTAWSNFLNPSALLNQESEETIKNTTILLG